MSSQLWASDSNLQVGQEGILELTALGFRFKPSGRTKRHPRAHSSGPGASDSKLKAGQEGILELTALGLRFKSSGRTRMHP